LVLSCLSAVEPTTRTVYPFEAEARLITDPIVNGAVALEDFIGGILQPQFSGDKGAAPASYDKKPAAPSSIPCGDYGSKRRSLVVGALSGHKGDGGKGNSDCGVYDAANSGLESEETCEYVHETVFVTKYKTECSKTYSTQCQTSYKTECLSSLSRECRTEYTEECSVVDTEECVTVDKPNYTEECSTEYENICSGGQGGGHGTYGVGATCQQVPKKVCKQIAHSNFQTECAKVPKKSCVTLPFEKCGQVPKQDCKLVPTATNCKDIPEKQCRQRAYRFWELVSSFFVFEYVHLLLRVSTTRATISL
jgi:hypothetical protein